MSAPPGTLWRITVEVPPALIEPADEILSEHGYGISAFEITKTLWRVETVTDTAPDKASIVAAFSVAAMLAGAKVPEVSVVLLPQVDWLAENRRSFPPLDIGRIHVRGSHIEERPAPGRIDIVLDAAQAFGSGAHATTSGCLQMLQRVCKRGRPATVLDLGCGSGILAIAAAKLLPSARVTAVDIDPVSVETAAGNMADNGVARRVSTGVSIGYRSPMVRGAGRWELVMANILANPLMAMAPNLKSGLAPGGVAILSGLTTDQEARVIAAHRTQGLHLLDRLRIDGWSTLLVG